MVTQVDENAQNQRQQQAAETVDDNIVKGVVSLEDLFRRIDQAVERYTRMELYLHIQLITGPEVLKFGGKLQGVVARNCPIDARYMRTYWKSRGMKVVERAMHYSRQRMSNAMKKKFIGKKKGDSGGESMYLSLIHI